MWQLLLNKFQLQLRLCMVYMFHHYYNNHQNIRMALFQYNHLNLEDMQSINLRTFNNYFNMYQRMIHMVHSFHKLLQLMLLHYMLHKYQIYQLKKMDLLKEQINNYLCKLMLKQQFHLRKWLYQYYNFNMYYRKFSSRYLLNMHQLKILKQQFYQHQASYLIQLHNIQVLHLIILEYNLLYMLLRILPQYLHQQLELLYMKLYQLYLNYILNNLKFLQLHFQLQSQFMLNQN